MMLKITLKIAALAAYAGLVLGALSPVEYNLAPPMSIPMFYKVTHYALTESCCGPFNDGFTATMTRAKPGRTIAVDPKIIPYGSKVVIRGKAYTAEDCGGKIKGRRIDILVSSEREAWEKGWFMAMVDIK